MKNNKLGTSDQSIGAVVRYWRQQKNKSQMELAMDIGISTRHLSYVETGKSQPSRNMVLYLGQALQLPYRQQNSLLLAAGYAAQFKEKGIDSEEMKMVRESLQNLLENHNPYPALVINSRYDIMTVNQGYAAFIDHFLGTEQTGKYDNALRLFYADDGLKPYVANWDVVAPLLLARVHEEAISIQDGFMLQLVSSLTTSIETNQAVDLIGYGLPMLSLEFKINGEIGRFFTTIATIGTPLDLTTQEIRLEMLYPADEATKKLYQSIMQ